LAQNGGGYLLALSASSYIFFNLGGGSAYGTATGGSSSSITIGAINYTLLTFTSTGTLTVTKAGFFDYLAVGGGSGNGYYVAGANAGAGGGSGCLQIGSIYLDTNQTITIGGGSATAQWLNVHTASNTSIAATSPFTQTIGGNVSDGDSSGIGRIAVGGGMGSIAAQTSIAYTSAYGRNGGNSTASTNAGGGGGQSAVGGNGTSTTGGAGGAGFDVSVFISGSALFKAMGGAGGGTVTGGTAATNGVAGSTNATPSNGNVNSGGGGGGGVGVTTTGNGGSGICYIRFEV
jgi:hypothetical protein